jgi:hypothetical protein
MADCQAENRTETFEITSLQCSLYQTYSVQKDIFFRFPLLTRAVTFHFAPLSLVNLNCNLVIMVIDDRTAVNNSVGLKYKIKYFNKRSPK